MADNDWQVPANLPEYLKAAQEEVDDLTTSLRRIATEPPSGIVQPVQALVALLNQRSGRLRMLQRNYAAVRFRQIRAELKALADEAIQDINLAEQLESEREFLQLMFV